MKEYLTFDDVLIRPQYSEIGTRESISTAPNFLGLDMTVPIISANMDYVTGREMAIAIWRAGGLGIQHRFSPWEEQIADIYEVAYESDQVAFSVGTRDMYDTLYKISKVEESIQEFKSANKIVCIDVAHGHHGKVIDLIKKIKDKYGDGWKIIAGNVATDTGFVDLVHAGADAIKVGIGPGSVCTTRTVTGVGVPQLSAIFECSHPSRQYNIPLIADGGIKNSGDIAKAIGAGASVVMLGHLLAGTTEAPGTIVQAGDGRAFKPYRGQSIFGVNGIREVPEGISGYVAAKGPVADVIKKLVGGLKSAMSYVGANNIKEFQQNVEFIKVTGMSHLESGTRVQQNV